MVMSLMMDRSPGGREVHRSVRPSVLPGLSGRTGCCSALESLVYFRFILIFFFTISPARHTAYMLLRKAFCVWVAPSLIVRAAMHWRLGNGAAVLGGRPPVVRRVRRFRD